MLKTNYVIANENKQKEELRTIEITGIIFVLFPLKLFENVLKTCLTTTLEILFIIKRKYDCWGIVFMNH